MWKLVRLLYSLPPETYVFVGNILTALLGNDPRDVKARRVQAEVSKELAEALIKRALK